MTRYAWGIGLLVLGMALGGCGEEEEADTESLEVAPSLEGAGGGDDDDLEEPEEDEGDEESERSEDEEQDDDTDDGDSPALDEALDRAEEAQAPALEGTGSDDRSAFDIEE